MKFKVNMFNENDLFRFTGKEKERERESIIFPSRFSQNGLDLSCCPIELRCPSFSKIMTERGQIFSLATPALFKRNKENLIVGLINE